MAIGDLHGDFEKTRRAFRLGGLTDDKDRWIGGESVCVQVRRTFSVLLYSAYIVFANSIIDIMPPCFGPFLIFAFGICSPQHW